jgi:hypothetical protein
MAAAVGSMARFRYDIEGSEVVLYVCGPCDESTYR